MKPEEETYIHFIPLKPIRDMRVIKGPLEKLISEDIIFESNHEDYIHAILTNKGELMDPMNTLRSVYPNILSMEMNRENSNEKVMEISDLHREKDPFNLFNLFHEVVEGTSLEEAEGDFLKTIIEKAMKGDA